MDGKGGIMMCKLKGRMEKARHYDVQIKRWMKKVALMCNLTGRMDK